MNATAMKRGSWLIGCALMLCAAPAFANQASLSDPARGAQPAERAPQAAEQTKAVPVIVLVGYEQEPVITAANKQLPLKSGTAIPFGTIATTGDSRVGFAVARSSSLPEEHQDLLLIGPNSRVEIIENMQATGTAPGAPPVVAIVHQGSYRAIARDPQGKPAFTVKIAGATVNLDKADAAGLLGPSAEKLEHWVFAGSITIDLGGRRLRLLNGMHRTIEGSKVFGAKHFEPEERKEALNIASVKSVDVTQPTFVAPAPAAPLALPAGVRAAAGANPTDPVSRGAPAPGRPGDVHAAPVVEVGTDPIYVRMQTSKGVVFLELDPAKAPISVGNFLAYADQGAYDGTVFHRVMSDFMIQGGGFDPNLVQKPTRAPIKNEWQNGLKNARGSIAMARTPVPDSATSQFFINVVDNAKLDQPSGGAAYAVFGRVVGGMDVVDQIKSVPTTAKGAHGNVPLEPVMIEKVERTTKEKALGGS